MACDIKYTQSYDFQPSQGNPRGEECQQNLSKLLAISRKNQNYKQQDYDTCDDDRKKNEPESSSKQNSGQLPGEMKPVNLFKGINFEERSSGGPSSCKSSPAQIELQSRGQQDQYLLQLQKRQSHNFYQNQQPNYKELYLQTKNKYSNFKKQSRAYITFINKKYSQLKLQKESKMKESINRQEVFSQQIKNVNLEKELLQFKLQNAQQDIHNQIHQKDLLKKEIQELILGLSISNQLVEKEKSKAKAKIQLLEEDNQNLRISLQHFQKQFQLAKKQTHIKEEQNVKAFQEKQRLLEKIQSQKQQCKSQLKRSQVQAKKIMDQLAAAKQEENQTKSKLSFLNIEVQNLKNQLQISKKQSNRLTAELDRSNKQKIQLQKSKSAQIEALRKQLSKSQFQTKAVKQKMKKNECQLSSLNDQFKKCELKVKKLQIQKIGLIEQIRQYRDIVQHKTDFLNKSIIEGQSKQKQIDSLYNYLQAIDQQFGIECGNHKKQNYNYRIKEEFVKIKYFNDSQILVGPQAHKKVFVHQAINNFMDVKGFKTKLLYKFDPFNNANFHNYFDYRPNLIIFIKLANNLIIGGFTAHPFDPDNVVKPGRGFLFSISEQRVYKMRPNPRLPVTTYDKYYFILGNAEIRIKIQQKKVFSNFGINTSTFESQGQNKLSFMNMRQGDNSQVDIATYEIYQLLMNE